MQPSAQQIAHLNDAGVVSVEQRTAGPAVCQMRHIMKTLLAKKAGSRELAFSDMSASTGAHSKMKPMLIKNASAYAPALLKTRFMRDAKEVARQILGAEARLSLDMLIVKPPKPAASTPWHQDEVGCDPKFEQREITPWLPRAGAAVESSGMNLIRGSRIRAVFCHRFSGHDPTVQALNCCGELEPGEAPRASFRGSAVAFHYGRTLHIAGGNQTGQPRFACILRFHVPPTPIVERRSSTGLAEKCTDDGGVAEARMFRGGIVSSAIRKLRRGKSQLERASL